MLKLIYGITGFIGNLFSRGNKKEWERVKKEITNPYDACEYMRINFTHIKTETFNAGELPEKLLYNKRGVCIDFAMFVYHLLRNHGYKCYILGMYKHKDYTSGHAICIFSKDNTIGYVSNFNCVAGFNSQREIWDMFSNRGYTYKKVIRGDINAR